MTNKAADNPVTTFVLGLVAVFATIVGLGAIGGGGDFARRNNQDAIRWGGAAILAAIALAALALYLAQLKNPRAQPISPLVVLLAAIVGVAGLGLGGFAVSDATRGRPEVDVTMHNAPLSIEIAVRASGLKTSDSVNLTVTAYTDRFAQQQKKKLVLLRTSFGPDTDGKATQREQVPLPSMTAYRSMVVRTWVGDDPRHSGRCLLEISANKAPDTGTPPGCVFIPIGLLNSAQ